MKYTEQEDILIKECLEQEITYQQMSDFIWEDFNIYRSSASIQQRVSRLHLSSNINKRFTHEEYIDKLVGRNIKVLDTYINANTKIKHKCLKCSTVWLTTPGHILNGTGCPSCNKKQHCSNKEYLDKLHKITTTIIAIDKYIAANTKIKHKCTICSNIWLAKPTFILRKHGCPKCANKNMKGLYGSMSEEKAGKLKFNLYLYHVKLQFEDEIFYKYGLTKHTDKRRYNNYQPYKVIEEISFEKYNAWKAICKERNLVSNYTPIHTFGGHTECYKLESSSDDINNN